MSEKTYSPIFPKMCRKATKTRAVLKSKINNERGSAIVEEPKPAMVPAISAKNAMIKKIKSIKSF
jgi:hypothetical protein